MDVSTILIILGACFLVYDIIQRTPKERIVYKYVERDLDTCFTQRQSPYALYQSAFERSGNPNELR